MIRQIFSLLLFLLLLNGCYTFKDISIKPDVKSFYVETFGITANAPGNIPTDFTEALKNRVRTETRLTYDELDPHILFEGTITGFSVVSTATDAQNTASLNKLEVRIRVSYTNVLHEEENWESTFSDFANFERNVNLADVQEDLLDEIFDQILESIINRAFSNW
jgi:hypothetical protein